MIPKQQSSVPSGDVAMSWGEPGFHIFSGHLSTVHTYDHVWSVALIQPRSSKMFQDYFTALIRKTSSLTRRPNHRFILIITTSRVEASQIFSSPNWSLWKKRLEPPYYVPVFASKNHGIFSWWSYVLPNPSCIGWSRSFDWSYFHSRWQTKN